MIELKDISINYGDVRVVHPMSLTIDQGEFFTLLGPSGCGKTTMLRAIAGFVPASGGSIHLDGLEVTNVPAEKRDVGIVFQNYALFPHMTIFDNVAFGLKVAKKSKFELRASVDRMLEATGISAHRDKKPAELSGGQQQRVAIARSLVMGTQVLLFDEPLSNLDANIREDMRQEIKSLQRELGFTAVFVTHDQEEALSMSDRLLVFNKGNVEQVGTARELYEKPRTQFVCQFVGSASKLASSLAMKLGLDASQEHFLRPEHVEFRDLMDPAAFRGTVKDVDYLGPITNVTVEVEGEAIKLQSFSAENLSQLAINDPVAIGFDRSKILGFGA